MNCTQDLVDFCNNASSDNTTPEMWLLGDSYRNSGLVLAVFKTVFILLGLPCNVLLLVVIIKEHLYHQPTIILLMNLAIADLLIIVLVFPLEITIGIAGEYIFGSSDYVRCRSLVYGIINIPLNLVSISSLSLMSVDRFIFIYKPLHYEKMITPTRTVIAVLVMWGLIIILILFPIFHVGDVVFYRPIASWGLSTSVTIKNYSFLVILLALVFVFLFILVLCNAMVACNVLKNINAIYKTYRPGQGNRGKLNAKSELDVMNDRIRKERHKKQIHLFRVFGGLQLSNFLTWFPFVIVYLLVICGIRLCNIPIGILVFSIVMFNSQVFLHPLVQTSLIKEVKDPAKKIISHCCFKLCHKFIMDRGRDDGSRCCCYCCGKHNESGDVEGGIACSGKDNQTSDVGSIRSNTGLSKAPQTESSDVLCNDVISSDVLCSDVTSSDVLCSDVTSSDVISSDVISSDCLSLSGKTSETMGNDVRSCGGVISKLCVFWKVCHTAILPQESDSPID